MFELPGPCTPQHINAAANLNFMLKVHQFPFALLTVQIEQNLTAAIRTREQEVGFVLGLTYFNYVTTVAMFLSGIGICHQIWKRRDTDDITPYSFLLGLLGASSWSVYGILEQHPVILYVNVTQLGIYSAYTAFYWVMSKKKCLISVKILITLFLILLLINLMFFLGCELVIPIWETSALGLLCAVFNIASFAAPLAMLKYVFRHRNTSVLPLPLCAGNLLVSSEWLLYGVLIADFTVMLPNAFGTVLASSQLFLFLVFPRKAGKLSPIAKFVALCRRICCCRAFSASVAGLIDEEEKSSSVFWDDPQEKVVTIPGLTTSIKELDEKI